ncbi:tetratricopeptide repeat protein [Flavobacterium sp.]|uniref:tetratricopeptide repeat-containing sensor histidine kinase n=1 Tax=Flavobacterium sp. TaxID=239 RepID=UPI0039E2982D
MENRYLTRLLCMLLLGASTFSQAQQPVIDSLKRVLQVTQTDTAKVNLFNALGHQFRETNPDSTRFYAAKAQQLAQQSHYNFGIANAYLNKGNAQVILSNYPAARQDFLQAQKHFETLLASPSGIAINRIKNGLGRAYASAGVVYSEENDYSRSLENYFKALKIYQQIGQKPSISKIYNNIGIVYKSQEHLQKALDYFQKALQIQHETGEQSQAVTLTNIGVIHFEMGNNAKALEYYQKAQKFFATIDNKRGFALLQNYFGDYYKKNNNTALALQYYHQSLKLYGEMDNKFGISLVHYSMGELYVKERNYREALASVEQSLALAKAIGTPDQIKESEKLLSEIYTALGDQGKAFEHYKSYIKVKEALENDENTKKFVRAEMNSEYEKKEALLIEQNKRQQQMTLFLIIGGLLLLVLIFVTYNRLQIKRRLTLQKEVAEYEQKALHLQMNPHFVFNCLGSISSFIVQNGTDSAIKYLSKFSKLMRLTLEYSKGSLIPIDKEIEGLQNYLELEQLRFNKKFEFVITSSPDIEDDMALPPLLIQPFVENAILHGMVPKEGNGSIEVNFDIQHNKFVCTITDDGIGFQTSKTMKENSVKAHQSMALEITKKRLEMMEATTSESANVTIEEITNTAGEPAGTKVVISLPIQYTSDTKIRI